MRLSGCRHVFDGVVSFGKNVHSPVDSEPSMLEDSKREGIVNHDVIVDVMTHLC